MPYYIVKEGKDTIGYLTPLMHKKARDLNGLMGISATVVDPKSISDEDVDKYFEGRRPWEAGS